MTIIEKTLKSVLSQNEQHEQIKIMANNGPFCKGLENIKGNIFESEMYNGAFLKSLSICFVVQ